MRTIIAGSRNINNYSLIEDAVKESKFDITTVISGTAKGIDKLGEHYAFRHNLSCEKYPAQWDKYGKSAGYRRNELMATKAEALIAIWDGKSKGTGHMINLAKKHELKIYIYNFIKGDELSVQ